MPDYYTLPTEVGQAKLADAQASGTPINLTEMAVGDGNGVAYNPSQNQTSLVNEVYRAQLNNLYQDANNTSWMVAEMVIPADQGGWHVREAGIFDDQGDMIYIIKYPETYKPVLANGSTKDLNIRAICEVASASQVTLEIDPAVVTATRDWVERSIEGFAAYPLVHSTTDTAHQDSDYGNLTGAGTGLDNEPKDLPNRYQDLALTVGSADYGAVE